MGFKILHISDVHIRKLRYHEEYRNIFEQLYTYAKEEQPDIIVNTGDTFHTKLDMSPEAFQMLSEMFVNLADIAPYHVILGNHDMNLKNVARLDAISPIVHSLNHPNIHFHKYTDKISVSEDVDLHVLSIVDPDNWPQEIDDNKINVALYHGSVVGAKTDAGWEMTHGDISVDVLRKFDYALLGDIHKTHQKIDKVGKCAYPGSLIQQNHGETPDKGFLVWDIDTKDDFTCKHVVLNNPKPFITVNLTPKGRLPNKLEIVPGARLRLVSNNNLPLDVVRKAIDVVKARFKPEAVTYLSRSAGQRGTVGDIANSIFQEDLRDIAVQEELIEEYLSDFCPEDSTIKKLFEMNKKYNNLAEQEEEIIRNVNWRLKKLEWDNLFNYGEANSVNFDDLNGIVGILGKNFSGKSSIIDSLLYTMYNSTSKNNRKNLNLINQNEESCRGYVEICVGTKIYKIERKSKKYNRTLKGKTTQEAKTDVEFTVFDSLTDEEASLNGASRMETDANIRKIFGTIDDFFLTSMSSQLDSLSYLNEGSTKRKEILAKFLDLQLFDKKFKLCNDDSTDLKGAIKKMADVDYEELIKESRTELARAQAELSLRERETDDLEKEFLLLTSKMSDISQEIDSTPDEISGYEDSENKICDLKSLVEELEASHGEKSDILSENAALTEKIDNFLLNFDINFFNEKKDDINEMQNNLEKTLKDLEEFEKRKKNNDDKIDLLKAAPCSISLKQKCHFVKDAQNALKNVPHYRISLNQLRLSKDVLEDKITQAEPERVKQYIEKYYMVLDKKQTLREETSSVELVLEKEKVKKLQAINALSELEERQHLFNENRKAIDSLNTLLKEKKELNIEKNAMERKLQDSRKEMLDLYKKVGSLEQKFIQITEQQEEYTALQDEFTTADLFLKCMHPNGISYDIIKKRLPLINSEVSKILTNIVDFEIFFENDETKLDILIKHPKHAPRPIEMGSGAEKTIAAMAIRLALLNVSTLPKGDIFILDEPGTALDAENMEGFIRILDMVKNQFKTVLLISHLDSLKDIVDDEISIEKNNAKAHVNH